jgi:hypothetical protein
MSADLIANPLSDPRIAVVIPCFKVTRHIVDVISAMPGIVWRIYVIDDACPEGSGKFVQERIFDNRVRVLVSIRPAPYCKPASFMPFQFQFQFRFPLERASQASRSRAAVH